MDTKRDQFTQRMLRRANIKFKKDDPATNLKSLRKLNILKAIENKGLQSGQVTDTLGKMKRNEDKKSEKESNAQFVKNSTGTVRKKFICNSNSWTRAPTPLPESIESASMTSQESEENLTNDQFLPEKNSEYLKKKEEEDILIKEKRTPEKRPTQFQESYHPQSMPDFNQVPIKDAMLNFIQNMQNNEASNFEESPTTWKSTLENCINFYSAKVDSETYNISNKSAAISKNFSACDNNTNQSYNLHKIELGQFEFPKNDLSVPKYDTTHEKNYSFLPKREPAILKDDINFNKIDLHCPRPYRSTEAKPFKSKENDDNSSHVIETFINDTSLQSYMRGFEFPEEKMQRHSSVTAPNHGNSQFEDWRDPSEILGKNVQEAITPQLLKTKYKMTTVPEKVTEFKIIHSDSEIKEASPPYQVRNLKSFEGLETEEEEDGETASGSIFSLSSAIKNLDEEIENLNIGSKTADLESVMETPKKQFPLLDVKTPSSYTPRKLFQKDPENEGKEVKKPEELEKVEKQTSGLKEVKSSLLKRHSSIFGFKIPKSWKPKPNLESTRKTSNSDLTKKTTSPSQVGSTLSSINCNTPTTPEIVENKSPSIFENTIPFEVEQFLIDALGEELYNTSVTYATSDMRDKTNSNLNASELISEDITPPRRNQPPKTPNSAPSKYSTLNRTITVYRSMSQRIKKKFRPNLKEPEKQPWIPYLPPNVRLNDKLQLCLEQLYIQQNFIYQASKALDYCRSRKEFAHSTELVESDRLILVANLRKQAIFQQMRNLTSKSQTQSSIKDSGEITIKNISISLKEGISRRERQNEDFVEWFLVVVSQGFTVWATHATNCPINSPRMYFTGTFSFPRMHPDFKINLRVYSLKIQNVTFNHEEKYHIQVEERHRICPSPQKLLMRKERPLSPKSHEVKFSGMRDSSFVLTGELDLQLPDLSLTSSWPLRSVPVDSVLLGTMDLSIACKLHLSTSHAGFLTHGDEVGGFAVWNRRWCILEGHTLKLWNYPREEESKSPLLIIDLMDSVSDLITSVDRTSCPRPRTFFIETSQHRNLKNRDNIVLERTTTCTIIRHLLQCDTTHELIEWMTKINHILSVLLDWNVIEPIYQLRESAL